MMAQGCQMNAQGCQLFNCGPLRLSSSIYMYVFSILTKGCQFGSVGTLRRVPKLMSWRFKTLHRSLDSLDQGFGAKIPRPYRESFENHVNFPISCWITWITSESPCSSHESAPTTLVSFIAFFLLKGPPMKSHLRYGNANANGMFAITVLALIKIYEARARRPRSYWGVVVLIAAVFLKSSSLY
jgi:hypothetical protein